MSTKIRFILRWILARPSLYALNRGLYILSLNGMGILNYEDNKISGEDSFLRKITKSFGENAVVLDVGANVGNYANLIKKLSPKTKVYSFEPHPKTFEILAENARKNGYFAFNLGCGKEKGKLELYDAENNDGSENASLFKEVIEGISGRKAIAYSVDVIDLDSFLVEKGIEKVNLLKIDVEGNEYRVLEGVKNALRKGIIEVIHFEFNEMNVVSRTFLKDFYEILSDYRLFRMLPNGLVAIDKYKPIFCEIYAFQNLVAIHKAAIE